MVSMNRANTSGAGELAHVEALIKTTSDELTFIFSSSTACRLALASLWVMVVQGRQ